MAHGFKIKDETLERFFNEYSAIVSEADIKFSFSEYLYYCHGISISFDSNSIYNDFGLSKRIEDKEFKPNEKDANLISSLYIEHCFKDVKI